MRIVDHWLSGPSWLMTPRAIIIHAVAQRMIISQWDIDEYGFTEPVGSEVSNLRYWTVSGLSYHTLVRPGELINLRHPTQAAQHASGHNGDALGLAFEVPGTHDWDSFCKYLQSPDWCPHDQIEMAAWWCVQRDRCVGKRLDIYGHDAVDPEKPDPGRGFAWDVFHSVHHDIKSGRIKGPRHDKS